MVARNPLVLVNGQLQELPTGDTINGAGGGGSPGGNTQEVQFNNAGTFAGAANVEIDNGDLCLVATTSPVTPPANTTKLFGKKLANRILPASIGPSGMDACLQPAVWRQKVARWNAAGNTTATPAIDGFPAFSSAGGTVTGRMCTQTNIFSRTRRIGYVSSTTSQSLTGQYVPFAQFTTGDGAGLGGFFYSCRFGFSDPALVSVARAFVGLSAQTSGPTNVNPSTMTYVVGLAQMIGNLCIVYGGSVAQPLIDLGANFPFMEGSGITGGTLYDLTLFSPANENGVVYYRVERVGTAFVAEGTLSGTPGVALPDSTVYLAHRAWRTNNTASTAVGIDIISVYMETDY